MRGVGYCENIECNSYLKGVFLLDSWKKFYCPGCRRQGWVEVERHEDHFNNDADFPVYNLIRVHFDFNPTNRTYLEIALVSINELKYGAEYEIWSPLIKTEERALKVAEFVICSLNSGNKALDGKFSNEFVMNFETDNWNDQIKTLSQLLGERERRIAYALRK